MANEGYSKRILGQGKGLVAWQRLARFRRAAESVRSVAGNEQVDVLLDIGAADGIGVPYLAPVARRYVGLNYYQGHSRQFKTAHPHRTALTANAMQLPLSNGCVEAVVSLETLHLLPDRRARLLCLDEIRRVLKPDGVFVCSVPIEVGLPAVFKYVGRRLTGFELPGMTFGMMLRHCFHHFCDVSAHDEGRQVGFDAYRFARDVSERFRVVRRIRIPTFYPLCTNLMLACRSEGAAEPATRDEGGLG